jgi:predicted GH43/DUF377 family glycosyl hydrolase
LEPVLEPVEKWERSNRNAGVEDPRITRIDSLGLWVMTYVAFGPLGPRPALAVSYDTVRWRRLGPLHFAYQAELDTDLNLFANKDLVFFPDLVPGPSGRPCYALLHRPMWELDWLRSGAGTPLPRGVEDARASLWIGYIDAEAASRDVSALVNVFESREVARPIFDFEECKIGAGPPPLRVPEGWLLLYHGVSGAVADGFDALPHDALYCAAGMILDAADPSAVVARSSRPLLEPVLPEETNGTVGNVVFPTATADIDGTTYVFYGMADSAIGVATLEGPAPKLAS